MGAKPDTPTAGVIGLGDIGRGVAGALAQAGIGLTVCDVRAEATEPFAQSARIAADPADLAATADVILVAVVNDAQVRTVVDGDGGALAAAKPGSTIVVLSTVSPDTVRAVAESAAARDVDVLDCGVSGGPAAAAQGALVSMLGGDEDVIDRVRPVLQGFSSLVVRMGPLGAGLQAKLARNLVQYASWLAAYEAQTLAEAAGVDLLELAEVIRASDQWIGGSSRLMFRQSVAPFGPQDHPDIVGAMRNGAGLAHKDLQAVVALGDRLGVALPLAAMTEARIDAVFGLAPDPMGGASTATSTGGEP
ncbi:MAG TPA: NAD(P)-dependent oxidoreductase [Acidimicrobiales bacterium]|nr:NAD(P)-dependent oxidoreductase [Acidimicrobiales bacterium]